MNVEIWDLYDAQGEKTGKTMIRGEAIPIGFYHIGVHIWPMNDKGELLIQRRSMGVQWKPGIWAVTGGSAGRIGLCCFQSRHALCLQTSSF